MLPVTVGGFILDVDNHWSEFIKFDLPGLHFNELQI